MPTARILHTADNHYRDTHLGRRSRGEDFTAAMDQVVDIAEQFHVHAIVQSGDLLDTNRPSSKTILDLAKLHYRLQDAKIWMFVVNGDHDQTKPHWADLLQFHTGHRGGMEANPGIYVLDGQRITIPGTDLTLYGMPFVGKTKERYLTEIRDTLPAADILAWHTQVREFAAFFGHDALTLNELPTDKYKFIALGDIHVRDYREHNGCLVGYPGSTELTNSGEPLQKTVTIVDFNDAHEPFRWEFVPLKTRRVKIYVLNTEEQVDAAVQELATLRDEHPIVFGKFNRQLNHVVSRVCAVLETDKAIVRLQAFPENVAPDQVHLEDEAEIQDFLGEFHITGTDSYDLAAALLQPDAGVNDLIDAFITKRQTV